MEQCFLCLQEKADKVSASSCQCKVYAHPACWNEYVQKKGRVECPLCHIVKNPMAVAAKEALPARVYVRRETEDNEGFQKGCICCCLGWFIGLLFLENL